MMNRLKRKTLILLTILLALTSCASTTPSATGRSRVTSPTLILPFTSPPGTLDPAQFASGTTSLLLHALFSGLMRYNAHGELVPDLATHIALSKDKTTYTFTLQKGATFHNGDPITANDIIFTFNRMSNPQSAVAGIGDYFDVIRGFAQHLSGRATTISGITAPSPSTIVFHLRHPDGAFLAKLTMPLTYPLDERWVLSHGSNWWRHPNGSGPFRLTTWNPPREVRLTRYDKFYGKLPQVETVLLEGNSVLGNATQAFTSGHLDLLPLPASPTLLEDFFSTTSSVSTSIRDMLHIYDEPTVQYLIVNRRTVPFNNLAARQALNLAINRWALVTAVLGGDGWPATYMLPPELPGAPSQLSPPAFSLSTAQAAWKRSPYATHNGVITIASSETAANGQPGPVTLALARDIQQAFHWQVAIATIPADQLESELQQGKITASLALQGWAADYLDPEDFLDPLFHSQRFNNVTELQSAAIDRMLEEADAHQSSNKRAQAFRHVERDILQQVPVIPLYFNREFVLLRPEVHRLPLLPDGGFDVRDAIMAGTST